MINDKGILIRNIYYMLSYAFQELKKRNYEDIDILPIMGISYFKIIQLTFV